jgi:uncharacterized protein YcgL (UPF0745 family)
LIIDIYTSATNGSKYLSVAKGTKLENIVLPETIDADFLSLSPFKTRLEIDTEKKHPALEHKDIFSQIEDKGYATHGAKITLKTGPTA